MLDHVFTDAIGALRDALEKALLERQAFEERFQADVLLGDLTWETSYSLPGEGIAPRVRCDITLEWLTWSQTAYRSWYIEEELPEAFFLEMGVERGGVSMKDLGVDAEAQPVRRDQAAPSEIGQ